MSSTLEPWAEVVCQVEQKRKLSGRLAAVLEVRLQKRRDGGPLELEPETREPDSAEHELADLTEQLRAARAERAGLERQLARSHEEVQRHHAELRAILDSRTWRWTELARRAWRIATRPR